MDAALTSAPAPLAEERTAAAVAAEAVSLAAVDSRRALLLAGQARSSLRADSSPEAAALVERALGLVAIELGRMSDAVGSLRRAVSFAQKADLSMLAAEARLDLSAALVLHGQPGLALAEAERAREVLRGPAVARPLMRCALILQRRGHYREALDGYRQALVYFRRAGDREWEARLLCNRGVLHAFRGELAAAEADLWRAERLHAAQGRELGVAHVRHNLGFVAARRGDVPAALALYDVADEAYRRLGSDRGILQLDRCEVLLSANLVGEARRAAEQGVEELIKARLEADLPEARLTLSNAALVDGDPATARDQADRACRAFSRQRRGAWAALARYASLKAALAGDDHTDATLAAARRASEHLSAAGWVAEALDARLTAGRVALELGLPEIAARELALASRARRRGPVRLRIAAWHAEALLRLSRGNARGAESAVAAGLRVMESHRAALGATELRAQASAHAVELAGVGVRLAMTSRRARRVLAASERCRASTWQLKPARPPDDAILASELTELRQIAGEIQATVLRGDEAAPLLRRQADLEAAVRRRSHHARGAAAIAPRSVPTVEALTPALRDQALVEFLEADGRLCAVTLSDGRARLWDLGPVAVPERELATLTFALRRLAVGHGRPVTLRTLAGTAAEAARRLDAILLAPLHREIAGRPLVLVPTGSLHATPWPVLESCVGRPLTVAASATLWHRCATGSRSPQRPPNHPLFVAGPGLPDAMIEVRELSGQYSGAVSLTGAEATVGAVTDAFAGAELAHIAAHGTFRTDNPLFSALQLADGPLTVYDLESLGRVPERLILSACDSGLASVAAGDELIGLSSALFALGTATVIGSVVPVRDDQTSALMIGLHRRLREGGSPAAALAECQAELREVAPTASLGAAAFVCFGAG